MTTAFLYIYPALGAIGVWVLSYGIFEHMSKTKHVSVMRTIAYSFPLGLAFGICLHFVSKSYFGV